MSTIPDPEVFFSTLGETVASQVDQLAGPDSAEEGFLGKVGRLRAAQAQAEELVFAELVYSATPEENPDDEDQDEDQAAALMRERARREIAEHQDHVQEMLDAADQDWRARTTS